jgi:hypothetical protein
MNERIQELAEQAGVGFMFDPDAVVLAFKMEKFAELIVQKCVGIVAERKDQAIDEAWNIDEAMSASMFAIEDYFGVER